MNRISLQDLNATSPARFVEALGDIFEHAPWVAQRALDQRPSAHAHSCIRSCVPW